jgi:spermidine/putrescine transport system permease protein
LEYSRKLWLRLWLAATFLFLYAPIAILILFSFNDSKRNIVWQGFTFDYYAKAWSNASLIEAFTNSLVIGLISTLVSTVIGALLALAL